EGRHFRHGGAALVEQLLRTVAAHPLLEHRELLRVVAHGREWHLVGTERPFDANAVQLAGTRPSFWRPQHDHWPARLAAKLPSTHCGPDVADAVDRRLQRC